MVRNLNNMVEVILEIRRTVNEVQHQNRHVLPNMLESLWKDAQEPREIADAIAKLNIDTGAYIVLIMEVLRPIMKKKYGFSKKQIAMYKFIYRNLCQLDKIRYLVNNPEPASSITEKTSSGIPQLSERNLCFDHLARLIQSNDKYETTAMYVVLYALESYEELGILEQGVDRLKRYMPRISLYVSGTESETMNA